MSNRNLNIMTAAERNEIITHHNNKKELPDNLKVILLQYLQEGNETFLGKKDEYLCCDLGINAPNRYHWITFEDCRSLGGSAASKEKCGM